MSLRLQKLAVVVKRLERKEKGKQKRTENAFSHIQHGKKKEQMQEFYCFVLYKGFLTTLGTRGILLLIRFAQRIS